MKKPIKRVAAIHDICGIGKAAMTNVMPVLATLGIEVCPIPTMVLTTHTGGFGCPSIVSIDGYINKAGSHYTDININFEGIFIGYLGKIINIEEAINFVEKLIKDKVLIVLDPIFADNGKYYSNFDEDYSNSLKRIIKYSKIITPNYTEACILGDVEIEDEVTENELLILSQKLCKLGCENIVITSLPLKDKSKIGTSIYNGQNNSIEIIIQQRIQKSYPGTGDIFTSVLIGLILNGCEINESVKKSCDFVEKCIIESNKYDYPAREGVMLEAVLKELNDLL